MTVGLRASAFLTRAAVVAAWLALAAPAFGEDRELPTVDSQGEAEEVEPAPAPDPTAFSTTTERRPGEASRTADLVASSPGVVIRDFGLNQPATVSVRGSSSDQVLVLLDGVPLNPAAGGGADLSTVPLSFVDRLTVVRGAVGARYGAGAVGGAVSLQTRPPPPAGAREWYGQLSYGSFGTAEGATGVAFSLSPEVSALVTGFASSSSGDFRYPVADRPLTAPDDVRWLNRANNEAKRGGVLARLSFTGRVEGSALVEIDGGERGIPGSIRAPTPESRQGDLRGLAAGRLAFDAAGLRFESRLTGRLGRLQYGTWQDHGVDQDETLVSGELSAAKLWGRQVIELGLSGGRESIESASHGGHERGRFGAWVSDEITWSFLTVVPAFRYERVGDLDGYSPRLGASARLGELVSLRANAGRSFRAPSFGELYLDQGALSPNPDLRPESGTYLDLGPEVRWKHLTASANAFWSLYDDLILYELYAPMRARPYNFGRAETWGGELEAAARAGPVSASAAYTLSFSANRMDDPRYLDKELPYRPRHRLHARLGVEWWRLEAHAEADAQSEQFLNRTNTDELKGRVRFDLGASVVLDRDLGLALHASVQNLFDSWDQDLYGYPLPGRSFFLAVRFDSQHRSSP